MVVYIVGIFILTAIISSLPLEKKSYASVLFWGIGIVLFLLSATRTEATSPDYDAYLLMYNDYDTLFVEPTFVFISWIVKLLIGNPIGLFVIYAALAIFIKLKVIKQISSLWFLSILTYISTLYIIQEHAQIRAGVATAFFLLTIKPLYERDWRRFLFFSVIATLFHYSAMVILPLWFIVKPKGYKWLLWFIIPMGYFFYFLGGNLIATLPFPQIQAKLELYKSLQEAGVGGFDNINVFGFGVLLKCLFFYVLLYFRDRIKEHNQYVDILLTIYAIGIFFIPAFSAMPIVSLRLSAMFVAVEMLLFPLFYYIFVPRVLSRLIVIIVAIINFSFSISILPI